jgi:hypothetical protein
MKTSSSRNEGSGDRVMRYILIIATLVSGFALAGCGAGVGVSTPLGGVGVSGSIGAPPPARPLY